MRVCWESLKPLWFNDSLEKAQKVIILMVTGYYSKRIQIKTSKKNFFKARSVESRKDQIQTAGCLLPVVSHGQSLVLPGTMCNSTCVSSREVHSILGVQGFYWGTYTYGTHMADLSYSDPSTTSS